MHPVERWLVARIGVNRGHIAAFDADCVVEHFCDRGQAVGRARRVRDDQIVRPERVVIDAINDGLVRICARRRNQYALGAGFKMGGRFVFGGKDACTF